MSCHMHFLFFLFHRENTQLNTRKFRLVNIVGIMSELITGEGNRTQNWVTFL